MQPLHPLVERAIHTSTANHGRLHAILMNELDEAKLMLGGAHAQLQNACDQCYGLKLPNTTYIGIHDDGRPWAVLLPNPR